MNGNASNMILLLIWNVVKQQMCKIIWGYTWIYPSYAFSCQYTQCSQNVNWFSWGGEGREESGKKHFNWSNKDNINVAVLEQVWDMGLDNGNEEQFNSLRPGAEPILMNEWKFSRKITIMAILEHSWYMYIYMPNVRGNNSPELYWRMRPLSVHRANKRAWIITSFSSVSYLVLLHWLSIFQ